MNYLQGLLEVAKDELRNLATMYIQVYVYALETYDLLSYVPFQILQLWEGQSELSQTSIYLGLSHSFGNIPFEITYHWGLEIAVES